MSQEQPVITQENLATPKASKADKRRLAFWRILALVGVLGLIVALFLFRDQVKKLQQYGYAGIFLVSIAANATVIIPLPGVAFTTAMGAIFNPVGVAVAAGLGASLGELTGYLTGFSGQGVVEKAAIYQRLVGWMRQHQRLAYLVISGMAFVPNPFFDVAGMAAGALKLPVWKFLLACAVGKILKMLMFAYAGYFSIGWLTNIFTPKYRAQKIMRASARIIFYLFWTASGFQYRFVERLYFFGGQVSPRARFHVPQSQFPNPHPDDPHDRQTGLYAHFADLAFMALSKGHIQPGSFPIF